MWLLKKREEKVWAAPMNYNEYELHYYLTKLHPPCAHYKLHQGPHSHLNCGNDDQQTLTRVRICIFIIQCFASNTDWISYLNSLFILGLLCSCCLSFGSYESSLHSVFTWFLLIVCFCFMFRLCLLVFSFALYFWWMGSHPWFLFTGFFFFTKSSNKLWRPIIVG